MLKLAPINIVFTLALICASNAAFAQNAPSSPPLKQIGTPSAQKSEVVPSLIVMNSRGATLQGDTLTLTGVMPNSIVFADRPVRAAGHVLTSHLIADWGVSTPGNESFAKDPPNATVSVFNKDGATVKDAVVVLKNPKLEGDKLIFTVQVLEGDLTGGDGAASIFIDIFGVWRRAAYRGAYYAGAAAAVGAAAAYAAPYAAPYVAPYAYPYAPPYRPACGYYPLPPCY
jgi:hypothetical protein